MRPATPWTALLVAVAVSGPCVWASTVYTFNLYPTLSMDPQDAFETVHIIAALQVC